MSDRPRFLHFQFLRLDHAFHRLQANEKVVARQEFMAGLESKSYAPGTLVYSLSGLRADCDVLLARSAEDLEPLQDAADRLRSAGLGKYLVPVQTFLGIDREEAGSAPAFGAGRYLFVSHRPAGALGPAAVVGAPALAAMGLKPRSLDCIGPTGYGALEAIETDDAAAYFKLWRGVADRLSPAPGGLKDAPIYPCVRKDARDLVETIGF